MQKSSYLCAVCLEERLPIVGSWAACQGTACKVLRHRHHQEKIDWFNKLKQQEENKHLQQLGDWWNPLGPQPPPPPSGPKRLQDWPPVYDPHSRPQPPQQQLITGPPPPLPLKECHEAHQHSQVPPPQPSLQECHEADLHYSQVPRRPTFVQNWRVVDEYGRIPPPPPEWNEAYQNSQVPPPPGPPPGWKHRDPASSASSGSAAAPTTAPLDQQAAIIAKLDTLLKEHNDLHVKFNFLVEQLAVVMCAYTAAPPSIGASDL